MASFGRFTPSSGGVVETLSYTSPTLSLTQSAGTSPLTATITGGGVDGSGTINIVPKWTDENTLGDSFFYSGSDDVAKTIYDGNLYGFYLDFAQQQYSFGNLENGLFVNTDANYLRLGDFGGSHNSTLLEVNYNTDFIKTSYDGLDRGLFIDFNNNEYVFGGGSNDYPNLRIINAEIAIGDVYSNNNFTQLLINDSNQIIKTSNGGADKGLYLDFANSLYALGDYNNSTNGTAIRIDDVSRYIQTLGNYQFAGLELNFNSEVYKLGDYNGNSNGINLKVNNFDQFISTQIYNNDNGLYINFNNNIYALGFTETGDFLSEQVFGFSSNPSTNILTIGDPAGLSFGGDLTLNLPEYRFYINTNTTKFKSFTTAEMFALPNPISGDMIFNSDLCTICFYKACEPEALPVWVAITGTTVIG